MVTGEGVVTGAVGAGDGGGGWTGAAGAGAGSGVGAAAGGGVTGAGAAGAAGWTTGAAGAGAGAGFGFERMGGGGLTPGAGTAGTEGTGLKSSSSGMPSAKEGENCARTSALTHAAVAAKDRNVMPPLQSLLSFAGPFAMN
jgi:hypothetical protein